MSFALTSRRVSEITIAVVNAVFSFLNEVQRDG